MPALRISLGRGLRRLKLRNIVLVYHKLHIYKTCNYAFHLSKVTVQPSKRWIRTGKKWFPYWSICIHRYL